MRRMEKLKLKVSKSLCITAESFKCTPLKIYSTVVAAHSCIFHSRARVTAF